MMSKMRRNFSGVFTAQHLQQGSWRLRRAAPDETTVQVQGANFGASTAFNPPPLVDLGIEWRPGSASITFVSAEQVRIVDAKNACVHEPLPHLYDTLPLPHFDAKARRFWRRVFLIVRIPGGRLLLKMLARSKRSP